MGSSLDSPRSQSDELAPWGIALIVVMTVALLLGLLIPWDSILPWSTAHPSPAHSVIHEDDPGWDCATMGNKICGPPLQG